jgi:pyruvate carboxylase subunit B
MIDTCNSSFSEGASHPTTESIVVALEDLGYETGVNLSAITEVSQYLKDVRKKYWQFESEFTDLDPRVLINQVPGGMISNLSSQLKDQSALDKMNHVLDEIPNVRKDLGYPPLVTPTSQIVGTQAVLNVITGERYKSITNEVKNYFLGQYGAAPGNVDEKIKKLAIADQKPITCRPADLIKPEIESLKVKSEAFAKNDEDILTYAMFPDLAEIFLQERNAGTLEPEVLLDKSEANQASGHYAPSEFNITLHGETYHIKLTGSGHAGEAERPFYVSVDGVTEEVLVETLDEILVNGNSQASGDKVKNSSSSASRPKPSHDGCVTTAMPGTIIDIKVAVGDKVSAGDGVVVIEAMKMENEIQAPKAGTVTSVHIAKGDSVSPNETLIEIQ